MIAKEQRLAKRQIEYIQKKGSKFENKCFIVKHKDALENGRYCIIISKKFASKAVERNKLRRQIYEAIRKNQPDSLSQNLILIPKKGITDKSFAEIESEIIEIFNKLNG
jgi:ribonuclease P protein component